MTLSSSAPQQKPNTFVYTLHNITQTWKNMRPQWLTIVTSRLGVGRGMEKGSGAGKNKNTSKIETDPWY